MSDSDINMIRVCLRLGGVVGAHIEVIMLDLHEMPVHPEHGLVVGFQLPRTLLWSMFACRQMRATGHFTSDTICLTYAYIYDLQLATHFRYDDGFVDCV